jgi:hypothetical protein
VPIDPPDRAPLGEPPPDLIRTVVNLAGAPDGELPAKKLDRNLVVGSWNVREFGRLTPRWGPEGDEKLKRIRPSATERPPAPRSWH